MAIRTRPATPEYRANWEVTFGQPKLQAYAAGPGRLAFKAYPKDWPRRYNGCGQPCDVLVGPCCCGAWHDGKDQEEWLATRRVVLAGRR